MDHFFTRNSMGRVFGFLEVNSVRKKWKIYPNFKIPEIFGFLDLGLSLEPDTWLYLFGHGISQTQPMWGHTQNFSSFGPLILHLPGGGWISPPPSLKCVAGTPSLLGLKVFLDNVIFLYWVVSDSHVESHILPFVFWQMSNYRGWSTGGSGGWLKLHSNCFSVFLETFFI